MTPTQIPASSHYDLIARAIGFLCEAPSRAAVTGASAQPSLSDLAQALGLSPAHLQRVFQAWAGISPKRFAQFLSKERALAELRSGGTVLEAAHAAGLSGSGRLHDLLITWEAMTPGEARQGGAGLTLQWGWAETPVGWGLVAMAPRGLCHLSLSDRANAAHEQEMRALWPQAQWVHDAEAAAGLLARVFGHGVCGHGVCGHGLQPRPSHGETGSLNLLLRGSPFQLKVWEALMRTEPGQLLSYSELARRSGHPKAARAVGTAMAANTIAVLVPCHRVIRESADIGQYRWGPVRKRALQTWEAGHFLEA